MGATRQRRKSWEVAPGVNRRPGATPHRFPRPGDGTQRRAGGVATPDPNPTPVYVAAYEGARRHGLSIVEALDFAGSAVRGARAERAALDVGEDFDGDMPTLAEEERRSEAGRWRGLAFLAQDSLMVAVLFRGEGAHVRRAGRRLWLSWVRRPRRRMPVDLMAMPEPLDG